MLLVGSIGFSIFSCGRIDTNQSSDQLLAVPAPIVTSTSVGLGVDATKIAEIKQREREQDLASSPAQAQVGQSSVVIPTDAPTPRKKSVRTGLTEDCRDVFPEQLLATNCWIGIVDGKYISVFAGSLKQAPMQGVLVIYTTSLDGTSGTPPEYYQTVSEDGPITINQVINSQVQGTTQEGLDFVFDLITHQWV